MLQTSTPPRMPLQLNRAIILASLLSGMSAYGQLSWNSRQLDAHPSVTDEAVLADFEFVNAGTAQVTVSEVKTSCGCTTAALDKKTYAPGEKGKISATFHIGDRVGLQQKQVMVSTDSPDEPLVQLTIRAFIPELVKMEPRVTSWPQSSDPAIRVVRIGTGTDQPVRVLGVKSSDDRIFAQLRSIEAGRSYEVAISVTSTREPLRGVIRVETDYPPAKPKIFTIPVEVSAPFAAPPSTSAVPPAPNSLSPSTPTTASRDSVIRFAPLQTTGVPANVPATVSTARAMPPSPSVQPPETIVARPIVPPSPTQAPVTTTVAAIPPPPYTSNSLQTGPAFQNTQQPQTPAALPPGTVRAVPPPTGTK